MRKLIAALVFLLALAAEAGAQSQVIVVGANNPYTNGILIDPTKMVYFASFGCGGLTSNASPYGAGTSAGWNTLNGFTAGGLATVVAGEPCLSGQLSTGAIINTIVDVEVGVPQGGGVVGAFLASELFDINYRVRLDTNDANTLARIGCIDTYSSSPPTNGVYLEKLGADVSFFGVTRSAASQTRSAALIATDTSLHDIRIRRIDSATMGFTVDKGAEVTQTATLPTTACAPGIQLEDLAAAAKKLTIAWMTVLITGLNR